MSVYRTLKRSPLSDVHHVAARIVGPVNDPEQAVPISPAPDWTSRRKGSPLETLLPMTERWMAALPFRPLAIAATFPRIANTLTALWTRPDALWSYLNDLFVDKRGGRQGFPINLLGELEGLRAYYATLYPDHLAAWDERQNA
jgi:hypothetical protein